MTAPQLLSILLLLGVANGSPIFARRLLKERFSIPVDGGRQLPDGQPVFGSSKTVLGLVVSLCSTTLIAFVLGFDWSIGTSIALGAMAGDLFSSFVKRRLRMEPHAQAFGLDQVPEALLQLLVVRDRLSRPLLSAPQMECVAPFCSVERGWAASVGQAVQTCLGICQQGCASTQLSSSVNPALSRRWMTYNQRRDGACAAASQVSLVLVGCGHSAQGRWIGSWLGGPDFQGGLPEETGARPQFFFDPQQLVVLR